MRTRESGSASPPGEGAGDDAEREEHSAAVERWRRARTARLVAPAGWLTLVDRLLLSEGDNDTPIGRVRVAEGRAWLRARSDLPVSIDGVPLTGERELHTEDGGGLTPVLAAGMIYELARIEGQLSLRVKDPDSAARLAFQGLSYYPADPSWRLQARFEVPAPGGPGIAHFSIGGRPLSLSTERPAAARLVFVFADETNRTDTYPGGRFLYADPPAGGQAVIDFNYAFNPPCAFTAHAICPAVPPGNRLPIAVTAGERRYEAG